MKFVYQAGLALLVNLAIVAGGMLPGMPIGLEKVKSEKKEEARVLIAEVVLEGMPENLKEIVLKAIVTKAGAVTTRSKLQEDIDSIFKTGWFQAVSATPSDTSKGVRVTFKANLNPVLHRVTVKSSKEKSFNVPESVIDNLFGPQYEKILNFRTLQDAISKLTHWCSDHGYMSPKVTLDSAGISVNKGVISLEVSENPILSAQQAYDEGYRLFEKGKPEFLRHAIKYLDKSLQISQKERNQQLEASSLFWLGRAYYDLGEKQRALDFFNQALPMYHALGDRSHEDGTLLIIGNIYIQFGLKEKGEELINQVIFRHSKTKIKPETTAEQAFQSGLKLFSKGDVNSLNQSIEKFELALKLSQIEKNKLSELNSLMSLGHIFLVLDKKQKALAVYTQALPISRSLSGEKGSEVKALTNLGRIYFFEGDRQKALEFYNKALFIAHATKNQSGEATILAHIGIAYSALGDSQKALDLYQKSLLISRALNAREGEAASLNNIASVYYSLGDNLKSLDFYSQALKVSHAVGDRVGEAKTLNNIGLCYLVLGNAQKALDSYSQSLSIFRAASERASLSPLLGGGSAVLDRAMEATILNNISVAHLTLGDNRKAIDFLTQNLSVLRDLGDRAQEALTLGNLGVAYFALGENQKALELYTQALPILRTVGDRSTEAKTLINVAAMYQAENKLSTALENINAAIRIIESLRSELKNDALKTSYFTSVQGYYQLKTDILMQLHRQQPTKGYAAAALENTDQSRARVLRELLVQANANINKDVSPELLKQEQTLNQTLDLKEKQLVQLASQPDRSTELAPLNQAIATLYAQRDDLKNTIRATNPAYANLQYPKPTTLAQIQQQLDPDTLMLQYSLGEKESYLWVIGQTSLKTYILPKRTDIEKTAATFRKELTAQLSAPNSALLLTQQILTPAAANLSNKRLVIIPDAFFIPFPSPR